MNEEPTSPYVPQTQLEPKKSYALLKRSSLIVLTLLLIGAIGYGTAYAWKKYSDVKSSLSSEQAKSEALASQNAQLQSQVAANNAKPTVATITDTLPNGKTITYPDTPGNRNILWWSTGPSAQASDSIVLSHKGIREYLSTVDSALETTVCGTAASPKAVQTDISVGLLNTTTKVLTPPQNESCLDALASKTENTDAVSQAAAQKALSAITSDVTQFIQSATIK